MERLEHKRDEQLDDKHHPGLWKAVMRTFSLPSPL
uniref:Uncharacterized protein n=1 Tax=Anguilla anguilla TaxID=7936 RepID=A0A0E9QFB3_ANGAN